MNVSIVQLGISNLGSLLEALRRIGATVEVVNTPEDISNARRLILPGVGSFRDGQNAIKTHGLGDAIKSYAKSNRPFLGICLGMQLLFDSSSEHGEHQGLGILAGKVKRLERTSPVTRIPNMGWCDVERLDRLNSLFCEGTESFYFLHSYWCDCARGEDVSARIDVGYPVTAAVQRGSLYGVQFHPEKSQDAGLELLKRFIHLP